MSKKSNLSIGGNYGLLCGIILSAITLVIHMVGQENVNTALSTLLSLGALITFMVLSANKFKNENNGFGRFGEIFKVTLTTAAIAAIISALYMVLHTTVIVPDFKEVAMASAEESILKSQPDATQEQIDLGIAMTEKFLAPPFMALGGFFGVILPGLFFALLLAAFLKKDPPFGMEEVIDQDN